MSMMGAFQGPASGMARMDLLTIIQMCGLTSGLQLCLDAGDEDSYSSGQKWLDLSGGGYDFFRGADGTASATDPTFTGTVGRRSSGEYWALDGGDYFTYDSANEPWMRDLHKGGKEWSLFTGFYTGTDATHPVIGTGGSAAQAGIQVILSSTNDNPAATLIDVADGTYTEGFGPADTAYPRMELDALAMQNTNAGRVSGCMLRNSLQIEVDAVASSLTNWNENAAFTMKIGAIGSAATIAPNGDRIHFLAMWDTAISAGATVALVYAMRGKFGK